MPGRATSTQRVRDPDNRRHSLDNCIRMLGGCYHAIGALDLGASVGVWQGLSLKRHDMRGEKCTCSVILCSGFVAC